jgi:hypothetical protein
VQPLLEKKKVFSNDRLIWKISISLVEKKLYTFSHFCVILLMYAPGGQPRAPKNRRLCRRFSQKKAIRGRMLGDGCLLVLSILGSSMQGVTHLPEKM